MMKQHDHSFLENKREIWHSFSRKHLSIKSTKILLLGGHVPRGTHLVTSSGMNIAIRDGFASEKAERDPNKITKSKA